VHCKVKIVLATMINEGMTGNAALDRVCALVVMHAFSVRMYVLGRAKRGHECVITHGYAG